MESQNLSDEEKKLEEEYFRIRKAKREFRDAHPKKSVLLFVDTINKLDEMKNKNQIGSYALCVERLFEIRKKYLQLKKEIQNQNMKGGQEKQNGKTINDNRVQA